MLSLQQLASASDKELEGFDIAEVDLVCAANLPGSERLNHDACLAWIEHATAWTSQNTQRTFDAFHDKPEVYGNSEGRFRILAMHGVLFRGMGIHYNQDRLADPDGGDGDSRTDFIHGIIDGHGGTCASLPVLYVAIGRRLGYPLKLVETFEHLFVRRDDPNGERFNIELNQHGLNTYDDEHYLVWPFPIKGTPLYKSRFLRSMTPREEVSHALLKRGYCLQSSGDFRRSIKAFAMAVSVNPGEPLDRVLKTSLFQWKAALFDRIMEGRRMPGIVFPPRLYPGIDEIFEREIIKLDVTHRSLFSPEASELLKAAKKIVINPTEAKQ